MYKISSLAEDQDQNIGVSYVPLKLTSGGKRNMRQKNIKGTSKIKRRLDNRTEIINTKGFHGEEIILKIDEIKNTLTYLKEYNDVVIKELKGEPEKKFYTMVKVADSVYDTPSEYQKLFDIVKEVYSDVKDVKFGTVGSYFAACMIEDKMDPKGCGICSSAGIKLPLESNNSNSICMFQVYLLEQKGNSNILTSLNNVEDKEKSIIYYPKADFDGLSKNQIKSLKEKGVEEVNILYYEPNSKNYEMLSDGFKPLASVKSIDLEEVYIDEKITPKDSDSQANFFAIMAMVLCVILIIVVVVFYVKNDKKSSSGPAKAKAKKK